MLIQDTQISHEAKDTLSSLPEGDYDSTVSKSPYGCIKKNHFQMDIPATGPPIAHKPYPNPLKYQKSIDEEIWSLESAGCILKSLSPWAVQVVIVPSKNDPLNPQKQQLCLVLDNWLVSMSTQHTISTV